MKNLPSSAPVALTLSADVPAQDIAVDAGGVITGNIQDQAHNNVPGIGIDVRDANHDSVGTAVTDASGNYSVAVPFGSYAVFAGGALNRDVGVSSGAPTATLNLTRFPLTGRLIDVAQSGVAGRVFTGAGNVTASALGTYTINVVQGVNWFLFQAPTSAPSLGFAYETNVLVNADTVKSIQ
jgi:hypothetical protein